MELKIESAHFQSSFLYYNEADDITTTLNFLKLFTQSHPVQAQKQMNSRVKSILSLRLSDGSDPALISISYGCEFILMSKQCCFYMTNGLIQSLRFTDVLPQ